MPDHLPTPGLGRDFSTAPLYADPPRSARVRAVLAGDDGGEVQVLAPEHAVLDLLALRDVLGRPLRARPHDNQQPISAEPGYYGLPVVLEESLLDAGEIALATGEHGRYRRVRGAELVEGHFDTRVVPFSRPLPDPRGECVDGADINEAVSRFTTLRLQERLDQTLHIPPLPEAARRIIALQQDPLHDLQDLVAVVEMDPSIASRIVGWANSAFYAASPPVTGIEDAIMRVLGMDTTMSMTLGMALGDALRLPAEQVRGLPPFWLDAVFTAATMEALSRAIPAGTRPETGLCYLAGLLANFGTLVVGHVFPPQYARICLLQEANRHLPHTVADEAVLQVPREAIAASLLELWAIPQPVCDAVRYQFVENYRGAHASYVKLLHFCRQALGNLGLTDYPPRAELEPAADDLGLPRNRLDAVLDRISGSRDELDGLAAVLSR